MMRRLLGSVQQRLPPARGGTLVLAYHLVGSGVDSAIDVSVDAFHAQLDLLEATFDVVPLASALGGAADLRPRAVLTFDDAYFNFAEVVWPILRARRLPAILYVPVGFVRGDAPAPIRGTKLGPCSFDVLRQLAREGLTLGSHGVDHLNLRRTRGATLERELGESRRVLEAELGVSVDSFCYPQAKHDAHSEAAVARHYDSAVVAGGRRYRGGSPHRIPRFPVRRDEPDFGAVSSSRLWLREAIADTVRQFRR